MSKTVKINIESLIGVDTNLLFPCGEKTVKNQIVEFTQEEFAEGIQEMLEDGSGLYEIVEFEDENPDLGEKETEAKILPLSNDKSKGGKELPSKEENIVETTSPAVTEISNDESASEITEDSLKVLSLEDLKTMALECGIVASEFPKIKNQETLKTLLIGKIVSIVNQEKTNTEVLKK